MPRHQGRHLHLCVSMSPRPGGIMKCLGCDQELTPVVPDREDEPTQRYQFDNALWIAFHGGYGMFVDNLDATLSPDYSPIKRESRILPGNPDYEAVICHLCAH